MSAGQKSGNPRFMKNPSGARMKSITGSGNGSVCQDEKVYA